MIYSLDVAEVAAIINVLIIIVKLSYPLLITLIAIGTLRNEVNAATWSVFGRLVNESPWRILLRTDTASGIKVDRRTRALSAFSFLLGLLLAISAAVTPLGLHETLSLQQSSGTPFNYVKDVSAIGQATPSHNFYSLNRVCGDALLEPCPGNDDGHTYIHNETGVYGVDTPGEVANNSISTSIAANITDMFTSATRSDRNTIASVFDIQYRSFIDYNNATEPAPNVQWLDEGQPRTQGRFRFSQDFISDGRVQAIEGLVVSTADTPVRGIGFRNHTLPSGGNEYGYVWDEDLLWLEPITECTDLNITYDFTMPAPSEFISVPNARLTDRGGFADLFVGYPYLDLNDTQSDPKLLERSWKAAVLTNKILMLYLNETRNNTRMGKEYIFEDLNIDTYTTPSSLNPREISFNRFGSLEVESNYYIPGLPGDLSGLSKTDNFSISSTDQLFLIDTVIMFGGADHINISTSGAFGGLMLGMGTPIDIEGQPILDSDSANRLDPGTNWSQPIYACVSATKASIKNVRFQLNGTASLSNLVVQSISPANFTPVWAMENPDRQLSQISPFWGVVSDDHLKNNSDIAALQKSEFYLPAGSASVAGASLNSLDSVAGTSAPWEIFNAIFQAYRDHSVPDLSGNGNWPLAQKWASLTANASTAGQVIDYIWTDLMANAVVSSKSVLAQPDGAPPAQSVLVPASYYQRKVGYDWKYAIPALLFILLYLASLAASLILVVLRRLNLTTIRHVLNQSSAGRAMTTERFYGSNEVDAASTKQWAGVRGAESVRMAKEVTRFKMKGGYGRVEERSVAN